MTYDAFANALLDSGLEPRWCSEVHWQIRGGKHVVNFYPVTKRGERFYVDGAEHGTGGGLQRAIRAAKGEIQFPMRQPKQLADDPAIRGRWEQHRRDGGTLTLEQFAARTAKKKVRQPPIAMSPRNRGFNVPKATRREIAMKVLDDLPDGVFFAAAEEMFGIGPDDWESHSDG